MFEVRLAFELVPTRDAEPGSPRGRAPQLEGIDVAGELTDARSRALEAGAERPISMRPVCLQTLIAGLPQDGRRLLAFETKREGLERRPAIRVRIVLGRKERRGADVDWQPLVETLHLVRR